MTGTTPAPARQRRQRLFKKNEIDTHPHARWLNRKIRSNAWGKERTATIKYTKANGESVVRKVKPLGAKGKVLIAHDYHRDAVRSFRLDRIHHMEKAAFFVGFEKRASAGDMLKRVFDSGVVGGALTGAGIGMGVGTAGVIGNAVYTLHQVKNHPENVEAKRLINKYQRHAPEVEMLTHRDLIERANAKKGLSNEKNLAQMSANVVDTGNAFYMRAEGLGEPAKQYIAVGDRVHPSVLAHEIGHYRSHKEISESEAPDKEDKLRGYAQ